MIGIHVPKTIGVHIEVNGRTSDVSYIMILVKLVSARISKMNRDVLSVALAIVISTSFSDS